MVSLKWRLVEQ
uniref:Uncharacterized protein n=1 Tax=Arundo donax TaxID=35708 RepID=A0A0A8YMU8_ARUDO